MPHPLEPLITSTGLRLRCLYYDVGCAMHRTNLTGEPLEGDALTDEQVLMALILTDQRAGTPLWAYAEKRHGRTLPNE